MPKIFPILDLRDNLDEISETCHQEAEPVFITKNGRADLVIMSMIAYDQMVSKIELFRKQDITKSAAKIIDQNIDAFNKLGE